MQLLALYRDKIMGAISGLDRIRFRGTLRLLANVDGLRRVMSYTGILLKDFGRWAEGLTAQIRQSCGQQAEAWGVPTQYLNRGGVDKEALARKIAAEHNITSGPICLLSVVEPCMAPMVKGHKARKTLELVMASRKCIFLYHYFDDPVYGFGHVRIQSWVPFNVHICLNGRHWLERQMQREHLAYVKEGNCFTWLENPERAQVLLKEQLSTDWSGLLQRLTLHCCPVLAKVLHPLRPEYYWSADETEWATDIMFTSSRELDRLYPTLVHHALRVSDSPAVMRYLGRKSPGGRCSNEVISDYRRRYEGVRVKHWVNQNSVKMYNKNGNLLRIETTINNTRDFRVFRRPNDDEHRKPSWQRMRKGVSDLHRRCEVSQQSNKRYADALATARVREKLEEVAAPACNAVTKKGKRYRGLNPWREEDYRLLTFLARGEHAINGFRNKDLRKRLYPASASLPPEKQKTYAARVTRRIKLLRVHGLVRKVPRSNRYVLSEKGRRFSSAFLTASGLDIKALTELAA